MYWACLRKDYPLVIRFILSCPILCPDICPHIYGNTSVSLSVMLSCPSRRKECTTIQALSESPLEVCILTRRVVTLCPWLNCFWVLVEFELYHHQNRGVVWIPCPRPNTPRENVETPSAFQTLFLEAMLGELERLSCLETRHGAFSSTFRWRILRGGYIAWWILRTGTLEGPAGWSFDPSAEGAMTTARPPLSLIICPCPSCQRTTVLVRVVTHSAAVV